MSSYLEISGTSVSGDLRGCLPNNKEILDVLNIIKSMSDKDYIDKGKILADATMGLMCLIQLRNKRVLQLNILLKPNEPCTFSINNRYFSIGELKGYLNKLMVEQADYIKKQSDKKYTPKELFDLLVPKCRSYQPGVYYVFDNVDSNGSEDRWTSHGKSLTMQYVNNKLLFTLKHTDEGSNYTRGDWNDSYSVTKEYPKEITFAELFNTCRANNSPLEIN